MPKGQLKINKKDAYEEWGISLTDGAMSALMTPPPMKDFVSNESRLEHGKRILYDYPRMADRDVSLPIHLTAKSQDEFIMRYEKFCNDVLMQGYLELWTEYQPTTIYRLNYLSCRQFQAFMDGIGKFILTLNEPNPADRGEEPL